MDFDRIAHWLGYGKSPEGPGIRSIHGHLRGIGGAVLGGFLISAAGLSGYGGLTVTTLGVMMSGALVTLLAAYVNGRRVYACLL